KGSAPQRSAITWQYRTAASRISKSLVPRLFGWPTQCASTPPTDAWPACCSYCWYPKRPRKRTWTCWPKSPSSCPIPSCGKRCPPKPIPPPSTGFLPLRRLRPSMLTIHELVSDNADKIPFTWIAGADSANRLIPDVGMSGADLVGHLNLIHPARIQVFGAEELSYYTRFEIRRRIHH